MKVIHRNQVSRGPNLSSPLSGRELYFFHERNTGVLRFHVEAGPEGQFPVEKAAGMLAIHCMVLAQRPQDYIVTVQVNQESLEGFAGEVEALLRAEHSVVSSIKLTRRQEEVLSGMMSSLANKEIARSLNLSERTVKFHLSSLLAKFCVRGRMELALEVTRRTLVPRAGLQSFATHEAGTASVAPGDQGGAPRAGLISLAKRHLIAFGQVSEKRPNRTSAGTPASSHGRP